MAWVYLDNGFWQHPKVIAAGPVGMAMYVSGLCYCKQYGTDGFIPETAPALFVRHRNWRQHARKLVTVGLWEEVTNGYTVHDYSEWNRPQITRSEHGRRAALARWGNAPSNARAMPEHMPGDALSPSLTGSTSSSSYSPPRAYTDDDDELLNSNELPPLVEKAIEVLAQRDLAARQANPALPPIGDTEAWLERARERRTLSDGGRLCEEAAGDPAASPEALAGTAPEPARPALDPHAEQRAALQARMVENQARLRAEAERAPDPNRIGNLRRLRDVLGPPAAPRDPSEDEF